MALNTIYNATDSKVFEQIKDLDRASEVWKRLEEPMRAYRWSRVQSCTFRYFIFCIGFAKVRKRGHSLELEF